MVLPYYDVWEQMQQKWPAYLKRGIEMLYGEYRPLEEMKAFLVHWGGINRKTFVRVLAEGQGEERLLAICVLGESSLPQTRALLLPFLQSHLPRERWLSAIYLGRKKEQQALPILIKMLTEYLPSVEEPIPDNVTWFAEFRITAADTLILWKDTSLTSAFRQAFVKSINSEQFLPEHPILRRINLSMWYIYQDELCYALGKYGAFGALVGISLSPRRQRIAMLNMVMGYKQIKLYAINTNLMYSWEQGREIKAMLEQYFGLSEDEQEEALNQFKHALADRERFLMGRGTFA